MCEKVITSRGKQEQYLCDFCEKTFDEGDGIKLKWRYLKIDHWNRHFVCEDCRYKRIARNDKGKYID